MTERKNVFLTGAAGVGKSFLLRFVIQELKAKYPSEGSVAITAPTGIAATHINGQTIHSFAGVGLGVGTAEALFDKLSRDARQRWRKVQCLIVDEVSILDSTLFEKLEYLARKCRNCAAAFGGVQLVLCGDFMQLPPVNLGRYGSQFCFESAAWSNAQIKRLELAEIIRQTGSENASFVTLLNEIRLGYCSPTTTNVLADCNIDRKSVPNDGILPTKLYCINRDVDAENNMFLDRLEGTRVDFVASDDWKSKPSDSTGRRSVEEGMDKKAPGTLSLKVGAQVMLTRNRADLGLVNGSRGVVESFFHIDTGSNADMAILGQRPVGVGEYFPIVLFDTGLRLAVEPTEEFFGCASGALMRSQFPLKLAWALTVHKSQGMTLSRAEIGLDGAFDYGQVYVALSRVVSLRGLYIRGGLITQTLVKAHPSVLRFYSQNP